MITILYDTEDERDNMISLLRRYTFCYDVSDTISDCSNLPCSVCCERMIENCIQDRADYQKVNPFLKDQPASCNTCANSPICWLATTAAAPAPCRHYIKEG